MAAWEERIDRRTSTPIVIEHVARYRFAMPVIREADLWVDLGCGTGLAASAAMSGSFDGTLFAVDNDDDALSTLAHELSPLTVQTLRADLEREEDITRLDKRLDALARTSRTCVTCFEVIEHLTDFDPLLDCLVRLVSRFDVTVVLSVPNDSFWSLHNPKHLTMWGGSAIEEFRSLLPDEHLLALQFPLVGTCIDRVGDEAVTHSVSASVDPEGVPSHYLLSFGSHASLVHSTADLSQVDLDQQRAWERQRESDLAFFRQRDEDHSYYEHEAGRLRQELASLRSDHSPA